MSWYSVIYTRARQFNKFQFTIPILTVSQQLSIARPSVLQSSDLKSQNLILGTLVQWSFYVCVLIELSVLSLSSFVYYYITGRLIANDIQASCYMVFYGWITFMMLWAYFRVITASPMRVPKEYEMDETTDAKLRAVTPFNPQGRPMLDSSTELQITTQRQIMDEFAAARGITMVEVDVQGRLRYCYECRSIKPDRSHHCSSCGFCAVRFDHHCPYLNSCVAAHNYKFFVLFLLYLEMWLIWNVISAIQAITHYFMAYEANKHLDWIVPLCCLFVLQFLSSIWPLGELLRYHWQLISLNETTCEQAKIPNIRGDPKANYDIGRWKNIEIVMGWSLWLVPVRTSISDGFHHPINYVSPISGDTVVRVTVATADTDGTRTSPAVTPLP